MKKIILVVMALVLTACSGPKEVSWETQESQRYTAKANSDLNAKAYRAKTKAAHGLTIFNHGDSTISEKCANGDGWSSVDLLDENSRVRYSLKCSTASLTTGCLPKKLFNSKSYANQDGVCNRKLPVPMPKLAK